MEKQNNNAVGSFQLGSWRVFPDRGEIEDGTTTLRLEPKVIAVLLCLVRHFGSIVTKQQLIDDVWGGRPASDEVISRCITILRTNLGDDYKAPTFIETIPKRGYQLIKEPIAIKAAPHRLRAGIVLSLLALGIAVIATAFTLYFASSESLQQSEASPISSVVVLPFTNLSADKDTYLADGVTDALTFALTQNSEIKVVARTSAFRFRDSEQDLRDIADRIGVDAIISGSIQRSGDKLTITAQLIDVRTNFHVWANTFESDIPEMFFLQRQVAQQILSAISQSDKRKSLTAASVPKNFESYDAYLRGRYALNLRGERALRRSLELFTKSIELDPSYGPAYLDLANAYLLIPSYSTDDPGLFEDLAIDIIGKGIVADPSIRDSAAVVYAYIYYKRGNWIAADDAFQTAIRSGHLQTTTLQWYSQFLGAVGRLEDSLEQATQARRLDPLSPAAVSRLAMTHLWNDNDQEAAEYFALANELGIKTLVHDESQLLLVFRQEKFADISGLAKIADNSLAGEHDWFRPLLSCKANAEQCEMARQKLRADSSTPARVRLVAAALLEDKQHTLTIAELLPNDNRAFEPELLFIKELELIRGDPRFVALTQDAGLNGYWDAQGCQMRAHKVYCTSTGSNARN